MRDLLAEGGTVEVQDGAYGEVWVTAVPVQSATSESALVIINFLDDEHAELAQHVADLRDRGGALARPDHR